MTVGIEAGQQPLTAETERRQGSVRQRRAVRVRDPAELLLTGAVIASAALLLALGAGLTFLFDDWQFLLY